MKQYNYTNDIIDSLNEELSIITKQQRAKEKEIDKEVCEHFYPEIKEQYEGKYFVSENGYSGKDRWKRYYRIDEVNKSDVYDTHGNGVTANCICTYFEVTTSNEINIAYKQRYYVHSVGKEITKERFNKEWNKVMDKINSL